MAALCQLSLLAWPRQQAFRNRTGQKRAAALPEEKGEMGVSTSFSPCWGGLSDKVIALACHRLYVLTHVLRSLMDLLSAGDTEGGRIHVLALAQETSSTPVGNEPRRS
jgi:hypothetical protein